MFWKCTRSFSSLPPNRSQSLLPPIAVTPNEAKRLGAAE
jgi:hypothetical protein